jgi:hypothetical protein
MLAALNMTSLLASSIADAPFAQTFGRTQGPQQNMRGGRTGRSIGLPSLQTGKSAGNFQQS